MRGIARILVTAAAAAALAGTGAGQDPCWDNDIVPDGENGRATSPPAFPFVRVTDDFVVPMGHVWRVCGLRTANVEDAGWTRGAVAEVYLYEDRGGCPGDLIMTRTTAEWTAFFEGYQLFNRDVYTYRFDFACADLDPGRYHIGVRFPDGGGDGTTYWLTSRGGEGTERPGCFSLDGGASWQEDGPEFNRAFEVYGVSCPQAPTGACCLPNGACLRLTEEQCEANDGLYRGDDVPCVNADCPPSRLGACCFLTREGEQCERLTESQCDEVFGTFRGVGVVCDEIDCLDDLCWDNGIVPDGSNWARAISPPAFPDIRVADDFTIPQDTTWTMLDLRFHVLEDAGWDSGDLLTLSIYEDGDGCPGNILLELDIGYEQTFMGVFFNRDTYTYFLDPVEIVLGEGHYWLGIRNPNAGGGGRTTGAAATAPGATVPTATSAASASTRGRPGSTRAATGSTRFRSAASAGAPSARPTSKATATWGSATCSCCSRCGAPARRTTTASTRISTATAR